MAIVSLLIWIYVYGYFLVACAPLLMYESWCIVSNAGSVCICSSAGGWRNSGWCSLQENRKNKQFRYGVVVEML